MIKFYKDSIKHIKQFGFKSLFFKYLWPITIIVLIPLLLLNSLVMFSLLNTQEIKQRNYISQSFTKSANAFDSILDQLEKNFVLYSANPYFNTFMLSQEFEPTLNNYNMITQVKNLMQYYRNTVPYVTSISAFSFSNEYVLSTDASNYIKDIAECDWYQYYKLNPDSHRFIIETNVSGNKPKQITFGYKMYSGVDEIGLVVFILDKSAINNMLFGDEHSTNTLAFVFDEENVVYSSTTLKDVQQYIPYNLPVANKMQIEKKNNSYLLYKKSDISNYTFAYLHTLPNDFSKNQLIILSSMIILLSVFLSVIISIFLSLQSYSSIYKIVSTLYKDELPSYSKPKDQNDELEFITKHILLHEKEKKDWESILSEKTSSLKRAQVASLQMQFTPHFLFNTLNHISLTIMNLTNKNNPASRMIYLLSQLLSTALDTDTYITTIKKEIEYAKIYVEIESLKHNNNFDSEWNYSDDVLNYKTPKLILQPILENAFKHGIKKLHSERRGKINISVTQENYNIVFKIQDNGFGIPKDNLLMLRDHLLKNEPKSGRHIGLYNVNQKIQLLFDKSYGVFIDSDNNGTVVKIIIPKSE